MNRRDDVINILRFFDESDFSTQREVADNNEGEVRNLFSKIDNLASYCEVTKLALIGIYTKSFEGSKGLK
jgi:hypothetical protein